MKIGVSSYSYHRYVSSGKMKQIEVIAAAKEAGFDIIEFSTISVPEGKTLPEFAQELRAEADRVGIPIANYTIGADFVRGSNGDLDAEIERLKKEGMRSRLILQVHDELLIETPKNEAEYVKRILQEEMEAAADISVPLEVSVSTGNDWYETK